MDRIVTPQSLVREARRMRTPATRRWRLLLARWMRRDGVDRLVARRLRYRWYGGGWVTEAVAYCRESADGSQEMFAYRSPYKGEPTVHPAKRFDDLIAAEEIVLDAR